MATNILMPALSPTMTEGTLARWLKREGDHVAAGDVIAEIETDKATMEVEAVDEGVLGTILVPDGTANVRVNDPIAVLVEEGGVVDTPVRVAPSATDTAPAAPLPAPAPAEPAAMNGNATPGERIAASPLARRLATLAGIDLAKVRGSGPNGRIVRADVEAHGGAPPAEARPTTSPEQAAKHATQAPPVPISAAHRLEPWTNVRRVTARRLTEAKQTVPHFYVSADIELDALLTLRHDLNRRSPEGDQAFKLSVNDMLIKACAVALHRVPGVNAAYSEEGVVLYDAADISVAVSIPGGLITPIVRDAGAKTLPAISREAHALVARARAGKLRPDEFQGGSFSISNMGMYGVSAFSAIINPPQAAILAVAAGEKRAVVHHDALAVATVMTATLSVDHRVIDGALAAQWLSVFRSVVEDPLALLI